MLLDVRSSSYLTCSCKVKRTLPNAHFPIRPYYFRKLSVLNFAQFVKLVMGKFTNCTKFKIDSLRKSLVIGKCDLQLFLKSAIVRSN